MIFLNYTLYLLPVNKNFLWYTIIYKKHNEKQLRGKWFLRKNPDLSLKSILSNLFISSQT